MGHWVDQMEVTHGPHLACGPFIWHTGTNILFSMLDQNGYKSDISSQQQQNKDLNLSLWYESQQKNAFCQEMLTHFANSLNKIIKYNIILYILHIRLKMNSLLLTKKKSTWLCFLLEKQSCIWNLYLKMKSFLLKKNLLLWKSKYWIVNNFLFTHNS